MPRIPATALLHRPALAGAARVAANNANANNNPNRPGGLGA